MRLERSEGEGAELTPSDRPAEPGPGAALTARVALLLLAAAAFYQGIWAQLAPRSFFEDFPGGMGWVAVEGLYDEHLVRDIGGLVNGLAVVAVVAAWTLSRTLLLATAAAWLIYAVPHLGFHLAHPLDDASMQKLNVVVLISEVALPVLGLLALQRRRSWTTSDETCPATSAAGAR